MDTMGYSVEAITGMRPLMKRENYRLPLVRLCKAARKGCMKTYMKLSTKQNGVF